MTRLLHVHSGNLFGGVETMLLAIATGPIPALENEFALCFEGRLATELNRHDALVHRLREVRSRSLLSVARARRALQKLLTERNFDAVACHMPWAQAIFGKIIREVGLPLLFWMHDVAGGNHWLERWARRTPPDLALCNSRFTASSLPRLYRGVPVEVVYPPAILPRKPIDSTERDSIRTEFATALDATVILIASRLQAWKGHRVLIDALARIAQSRWTCWIVGGAQRPDEERYLEELRRTAIDAGIGDRMRFCGERADVARIMTAADLYCQPNTQPEPFGIAFVEALNAGLPVITSNIGGATEIIDQSCGILLPPGDPDELGAALLQLMEDEKLRGQLGQGGSNRAARLCDPSQQQSRIQKVVQQLGKSCEVYAGAPQ